MARSTPPPEDRSLSPGRPELRKKREPNPLTLLGVGFEMAGVVAALTLGGWWLDNRLGTTPWLMIAGAFIGIVGGIYNLYRIGKRFF